MEAAGLHQYGFRPGNGLMTDMNAIRRDEELDNLHSIYVDQWDWGKVITPSSALRPFCTAWCRISCMPSAPPWTS